MLVLVVSVVGSMIVVPADPITLGWVRLISRATRSGFILCYGTALESSENLTKMGDVYLFYLFLSSLLIRAVPIQIYTSETSFMVSVPVTPLVYWVYLAVSRHII